MVVGSSPTWPTNKKRTFVYQKFSFCLSKPPAWYIIRFLRAYLAESEYIIKGDLSSLYLITHRECFIFPCNPEGLVL